jgi:hypothetical protein
MNVYGRFTAAVGSLALNVVLTLILTQSAGAAVLVTTSSVRHPQCDTESMHSPHSVTFSVGTDHHPSKELSPDRLRDRAILAVLLGLIV